MQSEGLDTVIQLLVSWVGLITCCRGKPRYRSKVAMFCHRPALLTGDWKSRMTGEHLSDVQRRKPLRRPLGQTQRPHIAHRLGWYAPIAFVLQSSQPTHAS